MVMWPTYWWGTDFLYFCYVNSVVSKNTDCTVITLAHWRRFHRKIVALRYDRRQWTNDKIDSKSKHRRILIWTEHARLVIYANSYNTNNWKNELSVTEQCTCKLKCAMKAMIDSLNIRSSRRALNVFSVRQFTKRHGSKRVSRWSLNNNVFFLSYCSRTGGQVFFKWG